MNRRRRRLLWIAGGLLAALLLFVLAGLPMLVSSEGFRNTLQTQATQALGRPMAVSGIRLRVLGGLRLDLTGVAVKNLAAAREIQAEVALSSLWSDRILVTALILKDPQITLERRADGSSNLDGLTLSLPAGGHPGLLAAAGAGSPARVLEISRIRIEGLKASVRDAVSGLDADMSGLDLDARVSSLRLSGAADPVAVLQQAGFLGRLDLREAKTPGVSLTDLHCALALDHGVASLTEGKAVLNGGPLGFSGSVDWQDARHPAFAMAADLSNVQLTPELGKRYLGRFLACFSNSLEGRLPKGKLDLKWRGTSRDELNASLMGKGELGLSVKLLSLSPLLPKEMNPGTELTTFTRAGVIFSVGNGVVSNTLRLEGNDNGAEMSGTMRLSDLQSDYLLVCTGKLGVFTHHLGIPLRGPITSLQPDLGGIMKDVAKDQLLDQFKRLLK